jgi:Dehydratase family
MILVFEDLLGAAFRSRPERSQEPAENARDGAQRPRQRPHELRRPRFRLSGTAFGSIVLHVAPEAAVGGPLAAVRDSDRIRLSIGEKRIDLLVDDAEIARRLSEAVPPPKPKRGYKALYRNSVLQAPEGCDFDFLTGERVS